jgi:hypothetical protein
MIWLWVFFWIGWSLHLLMMALASVSARSNALRGWRGLWEWAQFNLAPIATRIFISTCAMLIWRDNPELFKNVLGVSIPMVRGTCGVFGFLADSFADKIAFIFLKVEMPKLAPVDPKATPSEL